MGNAKRTKTKPKKEVKTTNAGALDLNQQRQIAKAGMVGSMGALFVTGFIKFKGARMLHPWIGWTLLGFSIWHHLTSKPPTK